MWQKHKPNFDTQMKIKFETKKVISVRDWDELVKEVYGRPYNFQQQNGCKSRGTFDFEVPYAYGEDFENDTVKEVVNGPERGVSFAAWLARDPKKPLADGRADWGVELWWDRNFYPNVDMIINDLHAKGLLDEGEYSINIDW